jgi:hypothetical protein
MVDPSGHFGLMSFSIANNIRADISSVQFDVGMNLLDAALDPDGATNGPSVMNLGIGAIGGAGFKLLRLLSKRFRKACNSFSGDTLVSTEDGLKPISEIQIGEKVWAYSEETGEVSLQEVIHLVQRDGTKDFADITLVNGEVIRATAEHPFYVVDRENPWVDAKDLNELNKLLGLNGDLFDIAKIEYRSEYAKVYNLTVAVDHTYFVGKSGALSHNTNKECAIQSFMRATTNVARKKAGFKDRGIPIILDSNMESKALATHLRNKGHNVRTITEIFGKDPGDMQINMLASKIGAKVLTKDRGRQIDGGFGRNAIQVDGRIRDFNTIERILNIAL